MGRTKGVYNAEFPKGTKVRIGTRATLEDFLKNWGYHNKLELWQLNYAGRLAEVESVTFYHGGDELYSLKDIPGVWHEQCLESFGSAP